MISDQEENLLLTHLTNQTNEAVETIFTTNFIYVKGETTC